MEKLNTHGKQKDTNKNTLICEQIEGTPFHIYGDEKNGYILLMGKNRLTEYKGKKETLQEATTITWDKIMQVVMVIVTDQLTQKQQ